MTLSVATIRSLDEFRKLREEWTVLLEASRSRSIFLSWEWHNRWWQVFGGTQTLCLLCARAPDGRLVGLWPLYRKGMPGPASRIVRLQFLGTGEPEAEEVATEYVDIIADANQEAEVVQALWQHLSQQSWDELCLPNVLLTSSLYRHLLPQLKQTNVRSNITAAGQRYYLELPQTWDDYAAKLSSKKRKRLGNYRRRLVREGNFSQHRVHDLDTLPSALNVLADLHTRQWSARGKKGAFGSARFQRFHRMLCEDFLALGRLDLRTWTFQDTPIAALYGFRWLNTVSYYQSGFDTKRVGSVSVGFVAVSEVIEAAIDDQFAFFDLMRGDDQSYKDDYACQTTPMVHVVFYNTTLGGRISHLATVARKYAQKARSRAQALQTRFVSQRVAESAPPPVDSRSEA